MGEREGANGISAQLNTVFGWSERDNDRRERIAAPVITYACYGAICTRHGQPMERLFPRLA